MQTDFLNRALGERPVVLVTGAGLRVGACVSQTFAARGYRLALCVQRSWAAAQVLADEMRARGGDAHVFKADARDELAVQGAVDGACNRFGRIDALVNCAAIWESKALEEVRAEDVRRHFEVNTLGSFLFARAAGLMMTSQPEGGAIVNLGDWAVARPYRDYAAYFPSKGAIPALTRDLAVELGLRNPRVRVNAILPGPVLLPADMPAAERAAVIAQTLVRREGTPQHVADAALFLVENDFITGVCLPVDGGRSVYASDGGGASRATEDLGP